MYQYVTKELVHATQDLAGRYLEAAHKAAQAGDIYAVHFAVKEALALENKARRMAAQLK